MSRLIKEAGFKNYTIFTKTMEYYLHIGEHGDLEEGFNSLKSLDIKIKCEEYMNHLLQKHEYTL
jgi:L-rhamnose mutarotase